MPRKPRVPLLPGWIRPGVFAPDIAAKRAQRAPSAIAPYPKGEICSFIVAGEPQTKGSWKAVRRGARTIMVPDDPHERAWHDAVAWSARSAMGGRGAVLAPIVVWLRFEMLRPQTPKYAWPVMGDADKLERSVLDAMSGIVYVDDRHVVDTHVRKRFATSGPGVRVRVATAELGTEGNDDG